jgi:hypothetical protein
MPNSIGDTGMLEKEQEYYDEHKVAIREYKAHKERFEKDEPRI